MARLVERTEGWAAGLQLAALALRDRPDPAAFVAAFTGGHRLVADGGCMVLTDAAVITSTVAQLAESRRLSRHLYIVGKRIC